MTATTSTGRNVEGGAGEFNKLITAKRIVEFLPPSSPFRNHKRHLAEIRHPLGEITSWAAPSLFDDQAAILWCRDRHLDHVVDDPGEVKITCPQCGNSPLFLHPRGWHFCWNCPLKGETYRDLELAFERAEKNARGPSAQVISVSTTGSIGISSRGKVRVVRKRQLFEDGPRYGPERPQPVLSRVFEKLGTTSGTIAEFLEVNSDVFVSH